MTHPKTDAPGSTGFQADAVPNASQQPQGSPPYLQVRHVTKTFGRFVALADVSLDIERGEFVCFLGPSGCGKTTLLRIIAGLEEQNAGQVIQNGSDVSRLPPAKRDFGIVFQSYALFPNLTAEQNIAYGLENSRLSKPKVRERVNELLELVGLPTAGPKYPAQLSGGQQQRIALARALALSPGLLLLDEPLSALDAKVRTSLRGEITHLHQRLGITTIMVTHDQEEALTMADRIAVMDHGRIVQIGTPFDVYRQPQTPFVANFVGVMNFLSGRLCPPPAAPAAPAAAAAAPAAPAAPPAPLQVEAGPFRITVAEPDGALASAPEGAPVHVAIRPEDVRLLTEHPETPNAALGIIDEIEFLGAFYRIRLRILAGSTGNSERPAEHEEHAIVPGLTLLADLSASMARELRLEPRSSMAVQLPTSLVRVFAAPEKGPAAASPATSDHA